MELSFFGAVPDTVALVASVCCKRKYDGWLLLARHRTCGGCPCRCITITYSNKRRRAKMDQQGKQAGDT